MCDYPNREAEHDALAGDLAAARTRICKLDRLWAAAESVLAEIDGEGSISRDGDGLWPLRSALQDLAGSE